MTPRIDAHQHFWHYHPDDYPWMGADMSVLRRDWMPRDLRPLLDAQGIDGCIAVQARADEAETDFLLGLAGSHDWIAAVVGWVDLCAEDLEARLERWVACSALAGFRHLLQDDPEVAATLADTRFNLGVKRLQAHGHIYEVLVRGATQLAKTHDFCARHDRHWLVLDHLGKPAIGGNEDAEWRNALTSLAAMPHVMCKVSGLVTEVASQSLNEAVVRRYLDTALELLGPNRLLFGSDWPVCLLRASHAEVCRIIENWTAALSPHEQSMVWGGNAMRCYGLRLADKAATEPTPWT